MAEDRFDPLASLALAGQMGLRREEAGERWGVAQWVCAQYSELGKFVIAKVEVEYRLGEVVGIEVAGKG
jgi:hypothetical protein